MTNDGKGPRTRIPTIDLREHVQRYDDPFPSLSADVIELNEARRERDSKKSPQEIHAEMHRELVRVYAMGHPLVQEDWEYVDPPGRFSPKIWQQLLDLIGKGNYAIVACSAGETDGKPWIRGQLIVSPTGMKNVREQANGNS